MSIREDQQSKARELWDEGKIVASTAEELQGIVRSGNLPDECRDELQKIVKDLEGLARQFSEWAAYEAAGGDEANIPNVYDWNR